MPTWACEALARAADAEEALADLHPGSEVFVAGYAGHPHGLARALVQRAAAVSPVRVLTAVMLPDTPLVDWTGADAGTVRLLYAGAAMRPGFDAGWASYLPIGFFTASRMLADGTLPIDVACLQATPPDEHGRCHLGLSVDIVPEAVSAARTVIAELNAGLPRAHGSGWIPVEAIDRWVPSTRPAEAIPEREPSATERAIAERVADLVPEHATLQLGLGGVMRAIADALSARRGLGIHSGLMSDGLRQLMRSGAVSNEHKGIDRDRSVATMAVGSRDLHRFVDGNPDVALEPVSYVHHPDTLAQVQRLVAINSAFEVDLTGAVNAEAVGGRPAAGLGGQLDFVRGAHASPGGRFILALPSTTGGRPGRSRIVAGLPPGTPVTTPRSDAEWVVTEHGSADLRGLSLPERAEALIAIAHPEHRATLTSTWRGNDQDWAS